MADLPPPPLHNGRYELRQPLGVGGMATVYLARDGVLQVDRAIKVLAPHLSRRRSIRERFLLEARSMARIAGSNVVKVYDFGMDGDRVFIVMEVVVGGSLMDRVAHRGPLAPGEAARIIGESLKGLAAAHAAGFVHRDVKPHNILLTEDGLPKLTDFGIAQATSSERSLTRTGTVMGTWAYMAPKQRTDAKRADPRSDIYSMGATLYACVTGDEPFDLYVDEVAAELPRRMPAELAAVVRKATRYAPDQRYASAGEMAAALSGLADLPSEPAPAGGSAAPGRSSPTFVPAGSEVDSHTFDGGMFAAEPQSTAVPLDADASLPAPPSRRWWLALPVLLVGLGVAAWSLAPTAPPPPIGVDGPPSGAPLSPPPSPEPTAPKPTPPASDLPAADPPSTEPPAVEPAPPETAAPAPVEPKAAEPAPAPLPPEDDAPVWPSPPPSTPSSEPTPPPEPAAPESAGPPGRVFINSQPYSVVSIDGTEVGRTPVRGRELSPGTHRLSFRSSTGKTVRRTIEVAPGQTVRLCWDLEAEAPCP